jgi:endoglucanase
MADHLAQLIIQKETLHVQGVGLSILPGPFGFVNDDGSVKLNPSYVPPFMMARLASHFKTQKIWSELYLGSQRLLLLSVEKGLYPDWIEFNNGISNLRKTIGDYDAIRVYLWIAITPKSDPLFPTLVEQIKPFLLTIKELGYVPETWNLAAGTIQSNRGPAGFQYALLPAFKALGLTPLNVVPMPSRQQVNEWRNYGYYSGMLSLLSQGYMDKRYSFGDHGQLITSKSTKGLP